MNIPYAFRKCSKCGEWKVANNYNFSKRKSCKWGLQYTCKICNKKYKKEHYKNNKDKILEKQKIYYENNKDEIINRSRKYYENNKDEINKKSRKYYENNKDEINKKQKEYYENNKDEIDKYKKEYYENNKDEILEKQKEYYRNNPHILFNQSNRRRNKENTQGRGINEIQWKEIFDFFNFRCAYSNEYLGGDNKDKKRTIDHIVALDNGGLNEPWNCVPMVKSYNSSKNKRIDVLNWYIEQEYFNEERLNKIVEWQIYAYEKWGGEEFGELILITDLFEEK